MQEFYISHTCSLNAKKTPDKTRIAPIFHNMLVVGIMQKSILDHVPLKARVFVRKLMVKLSVPFGFLLVQ